MEKIVKILYSDEAKAVIEYISKMSLTSKEERIMFKAIIRKLSLIQKDPKKGQSISKRLIPKEYVSRYAVNNLYRMELPFFWRMLYTLRDNKIEVIAFVLDIVNHKQYNKKFKYK
jgi:hypothetical protein